MAATDLADYLVSKGMPFREAHGVVGRVVALCVARGCTLEALTLEDLREFSPLFDEDAFDWIRLETVVDRRESEGGTGARPLDAQLRLARELLDARG